jgi:hypothetical protein
MVHSGYEASGVDYTFGSLRGFWQTAKATMFSRYEDEQARQILDSDEFTPLHNHNPLVQLEVKTRVVEHQNA